MTTENKICFRHGMRDGSPIALGYFAVAFTLGIAARNAGLSAIQALIASALNNASAGEYAGFALIAAGSSYLEMAVMTLVVNARYLLMSCALSQKLKTATPLRHRMLIAYDVTDEIFGICVAQPGYLNPWYAYGAIAVAIPGWALGTFFWCDYGKCAADQSGQRIERRTLRYVSGHHHPAGQEKPGNCGRGCRRFCRQLSRKPPAPV